MSEHRLTKLDYLPAIWFPLMYIGYKIYRRTKVIPPEEVDRGSHRQIDEYR